MKGKRVYLGKSLVVDPAAGTFGYLYRDKVVIEAVTAEVGYRLGGKERSLGFTGEVAYGVVEDKVSLSSRDEDLEITWLAEVKNHSQGERVHLHLRIQNLGRQPLEVLQFVPFLLSPERGGGLELGSPADWSFYQNGWQSWSPTFARHPLDGHYIHPGTELYNIQHEPYPVSSEAKTLVSHQVSLLHHRSRAISLLLGFVTAKDQFAEVRLELGGNEFRSLKALSYADGVPLKPGQRMASEELVLELGADPLLLLEGYAQAAGQSMNARAPKPSTGWCSWYYYYGEDGEKEVLANLEKGEEEMLPLGVYLIDDGYQRAIGDWLTVKREKFPRGMAGVREKVEKRGREAGIWLAPFAASSKSRLYAQHPDWVLRDEGGEPVVAWHHWGDPIYALDLSHTEVQGWLKEVFHTLSREWGYDFFKIDFLYAGALEGRRHDPGLTRAQALRRGLEIIRRAVGEKYILGCGCPLGPAVGLVDGMRIGTDVAGNWEPLWNDLSHPAVKNALRNVLARYFMHARLWANDPDCVLVRPKGDESNLKLNEARTLASMVGLSGGLVLSGDNLVSLDSGRLKHLKQILPPYGEAARPLDLFQRELPQLLVLPIEREFGSWRIVGVINWSNRAGELVLDLKSLGLDAGKSYHVYNFWRRHYLGVVQDRVVISRHQPHETLLLLLKEVSPEPQFLTSTFHITQGGVEVKSVRKEVERGKQEKMVLEVTKAGRQSGELLFAVPEGFRLLKAEVDGRRQRVRETAPRVVSLGFVLENEALVELFLRQP